MASPHPAWPGEFMGSLCVHGLGDMSVFQGRLISNESECLRAIRKPQVFADTSDGHALGPRERRACMGPRRPRAAGVRRSSRAAPSPGRIPCPCPSLRSPVTGPRPGPVSGLSALQVTQFPRSQPLQLLLVTWGPAGRFVPPGLAMLVKREETGQVEMGF